jgi:MFS family permease
MASFFAMWLGLTLSALGNFLSSFALGVWVYQATGSVTLQGLILFFGTAPALLASPFAGVLVDRWDRRLAMMVSAAGTGLASLVLALLFFAGHLEPWTIYAGVAASAAFQSLRWPAMSAATTQLVPKAQFGRATGLIQFGLSAAQVLGPLAGALLLQGIGLGGVLVADFGASLLALAALVPLAVGRPAAGRPADRSREPWLAELAVGWRYIAARRGLLGLLALFAATNFALGLVLVLTTPLVLSFTSVEVLGTIQSVAGAGMLAGGVAMALWGGPKKRVAGIVGLLGLQGVTLLLAGARSDAVLIGAAAFGFFFFFPLVSGCSQVIWLAKVAPEVQGRVFATRRMVALASVPVASLAAGPLADRVFEPLLAPGGPLAPTVGQILGVGPGSGIRLLLLVLALLLFATVAVAAASRSLMRVEQELPDLVGEGGVGEPA